MNKNNNEQRQTIYLDLKNKIINNKLSRGTRLVASKIASEYDVNRIHVNSALQVLLSEKLVEYIQMKGYIVVGLDNNDFLEIAKIRQVLEFSIIENFLQKANDKELQDAKRLVKRKILFLENDLKEDAVLETKAFFDKVYDCSSYKRIVQMLREYDEYINLMISKSFELPEDIIGSVINSELLYDALDKKCLVTTQQWVINRYTNLVNKINSNKR